MSETRYCVREDDSGELRVVFIGSREEVIGRCQTISEAVDILQAHPLYNGSNEVVVNWQIMGKHAMVPAKIDEPKEEAQREETPEAKPKKNRMMLRKTKGKT